MASTGRRRRPWRSFEAVEFASLEWIDWFNNRRLLEPIGNVPPAEAEDTQCWSNPPWPRDSNKIASGNPGAGSRYAIDRAMERSWLLVKAITTSVSPWTMRIGCGRLSCAP
jgi:hypothetical protein